MWQNYIFSRLLWFAVCRHSEPAPATLRLFTKKRKTLEDRKPSSQCVISRKGRSHVGVWIETNNKELPLVGKYGKTMRVFIYYICHGVENQPECLVKNPVVVKRHRGGLVRSWYPHNIILNNPYTHPGCTDFKFLTGI
jgi:hypothetical protein